MSAIVREVTIGPCRLIQGDCLEVLPLIGNVDAVVTDPPYGIGLSNNDVDGHRTARSFGVLGDNDQTVGQAALDWAEQQELPTIAFASPWKPWPGSWRNLIAWDKGGAVGGGGDVRTCLKRTWELIQTVRTGALLSGRGESVVKFMVCPSDTSLHICAKPVELMEWIMEMFITRGDCVCDPFMGSGTTGVACIRKERQFIGIEREAKYFDIACKRIQQAWDLKCSELPFDEPVKMTQRELIGVSE